VLFPLFLQTTVGGALSSIPLPPPNGIPPLGLFLSYTNLLSKSSSTPRAPFDGTYLAVAASDPAMTAQVASLIHTIVNQNSLVELRSLIEKNSTFSTIVQAGVNEYLVSQGLRAYSLDAILNFAPVQIRSFESVAALENDATNDGAIWAAIVMDKVPIGGMGEWSYELRFNSSSLPTTKKLFDKFATGLSTKFYPYYASGFLSLQTALNSHIYANQSGANISPSPLAFGVPFPVKGYTKNTFFDFAGNLIGLVVVFSLLIPLSTMLRALVLEKEAKLREELLMMGTSISAYYGSVLIMYGASFLVTSLIAAAEIGFSCYTKSDAILVLLLFVLFAISSLAFTLALTPFFRNARVAALCGPLIFFITSQFYNLFLDSGQLAEGMAGGKSFVSFFPAMGFYLGAALMAQYEGSLQGISVATAGEGEFPFSASIWFLFIDVFLWLGLAWYFDQALTEHSPPPDHPRSIPLCPRTIAIHWPLPPTPRHPLLATLCPLPTAGSMPLPTHCLPPTARQQPLPATYYVSPIARLPLPVSL